MTLEQLDARLGAERIVPMPVAEWESLAAQIDEVERHDTFIAGALLVVRTPGGLAAVEQPNPGTRVVRRLASGRDARQFVDGRLETYDNMWNGCGCKVRYYE
ncbi:MAG: hypothetical protein KGN76_08850 [Acidobacteriota bacterium]|nr:hypothetical protein [Acidobacteriota bacterium]